MSLRFLGLELFTFEASTDDDEYAAERDLSGGTTASTPIGFAPQWGEQRYEPGTEA